MKNATKGVWMKFFLGLSLCAAVALGQADPSDEVIEQIRTLQTINTADQQRIGEWVQARVAQLAGTPAKDRAAALPGFLARFQTQATNSGNSAAFKTQFAMQCAQVASTEFAKADLDPTLAWGLAQVLYDLNTADVFPGLLSGLGAKAEVARFISARALTVQREVIARDKPRQNEMITALQTAGTNESSGVVLGHIYRALAFSAPTPESVAAFFAIFDKRLTYRRGAVAADGAEIEAFEYFRLSGTLGGLSEPQKAELVKRVAVFLRLDAERYNTELMDPNEVPKIELLMEAAEGVLVAVAGGKTALADELAKGGLARRADVLSAAYKLFGDPTTKTAGSLNAAPWNVPLGAP